uniref:Capsid protein n=1 Tax=Opuntia virus 2-DBG_56 TaxID=3033938 RepID=A0A8A9WQ23_9GEMI|nr:capsid protein [Opuntia virus 2-DBG_56]QTT61689.1 capsid protein [Opuntia virus 2-DBG_56]QTT61694.1 capsid protein [Opuntia virus 2-DBG_56]QTT61714.1 capsid protein [Opuntia virus 2-DBG_56]QTT61719.1 capsid protein [Opuntia virus 2-DBG_56]
MRKYTRNTYQMGQKRKGKFQTSWAKKRKMMTGKKYQLKTAVRRNRRIKLKMYDDMLGSGGIGSTISNNGMITMLNNYIQGIGDSQRSTAVTMTKHIKFDMALMGSSAFWETPNYMTQYHWIIVDKDVGSVFPDKLDDIFEIPSNGQAMPSTFRIRRDMNERFIVKKKWRTHLMSTGAAYGSRDTYKGPSMPNYKKPMNMIVRNLNVRTIWKDTGGGKYEDVKENAILYVVVNDNTDNTNMYATLFGNCRLYFH